MSRHPDLDAALNALNLDPADEADADEVEIVTGVWSRQALRPLFGPLRRNGPVDPEDPPVLRVVR